MRPLTASACMAAFCLMIGGASAQTAPAQKVSPGNEPTQAVGSQVEPMKGDCPANTVTAAQQHPPTTAGGQQVPQMTEKTDCPDGKAEKK